MLFLHCILDDIFWFMTDSKQVLVLAYITETTEITNAASSSCQEGWRTVNTKQT